MSPAIITLIVLGIVALLFVTEAIPLAIAAMGGAIALGILGVIPITQVFSGLSNSTVILFAGMFVIGGSMFHTGLAQKMGETVVKYAGKSENGLMFAVMLITAVLSAVSSNTGTTAALMPVIIGICAVAKISASRQLMPLAFAAGLGGIITLVGTPPNIIAAGALKAAGFEPFGFFEFAWIGIPLTIAGMVYMMFIGKHLLPKMEISTDQEIEQEIEVSVNDPKKMWISGIILLAVVIVMGLDLKAIPLEIAAIIGAILAVLTGCLKEKQAYHSIDWVTIFLFAGMMPIAAAMEKSGAGKMIADIVVNAMGGSPSPMVVTASLFILSCGLTQFMSNTASTALLAPIGISIAKGIGASPHAVLMAIAVAASCAFATPVGTPPNTLVLGPGGYKFMDYVKAGSGLVLVCFIVSIIIIPMVWPFFPK
ncbi:SLC13 family permease [Pelosinus fermentans]|jgi:anion transporter|uniref:Anion transporter n=2 Tax=Pelosinus TaxID=365348 RepID=I9L9F2_9FIRM|nr:SLC13 family permease [Pelosinus fermentans]EIW16916.1 anion transporter [Pelosinus fermentans B4]EIW22897.1 anion transporter [Pelosinus fermentans A11]OAM93749.1 anion transporter [Pelosinus fermentans DSM 17108]SDQ88737.1 anion transporter [Pelosinus fermentans]